MAKSQPPAQPVSGGVNRARSVPEAAEALGVCVRTVWQLIAEGRIKSVKISPRRRVVTDAEINRILSGGAEEATP
jgi:excisionase family DNA binding protein